MFRQKTIAIMAAVFMSVMALAATVTAESRQDLQNNGWAFASRHEVDIGLVIINDTNCYLEIPEMDVFFSKNNANPFENGGLDAYTSWQSETIHGGATGSKSYAGHISRTKTRRIRFELKLYDENGAPTGDTWPLLLAAKAPGDEDENIMLRITDIDVDNPAKPAGSLMQPDGKPSNRNTPVNSRQTIFLNRNLSAKTGSGIRADLVTCYGGPAVIIFTMTPTGY